MDTESVVRELTQRGIIVTPEMLEKIRKGETGLPPTQPREEKKRTERPPKPTLSVKIRKTERLPKMSPQDFISYYNKRYEGLKSILLRKMEALSINKIKDTFSEVSVIGMVRDKTPGGFIIEDATGDIVVVGAGEVEPDDVVGVRGTIREGQIFLTELIWPDVPLNNKTGNIQGTTLLLTTGLGENIMENLDDFSLVFVSGGEAGGLSAGARKNVIAGLPNPCHATIKKENSELTLLIYVPEKKIAPENAARLLRRRHLSPEKKHIFSTSDPFLIEPVPDIFWIVADKQHVERYKGVTIIMSREGDAVKFEAETGKVYLAQDTEAANEPGKTEA